MAAAVPEMRRLTREHGFHASRRRGCAAAVGPYPISYLAYALVRGEWMGAYPYPFIDVPALRYPRVFANAAGLLLVFVAAGA